MPVNGNAGGLQHGRPINPVRFQNVLGHDVLGVGPEFLEAVTVREIQGRHIIEKRVEPDVGDIVRVERKRDAPLETAFGA